MNEHVTIMINGTIYDMVGEFHYFLHEIFPELKRRCAEHGIELEYKDISFSLFEKDVPFPRTILEYLNMIDLDRTFFICFRAQRLGWIPSSDVVDRYTLNVFPELANVLGTISLNELTILHALVPFDKIIDGELMKLPPVKHALFYFRSSDYLCDIDPSRRDFFLDKPDKEDLEVKGLKLAKAKDIVHDLQNDFVDNDDSNIIIRNYHSEYNPDVVLFDMIEEYTQKCIEISDYGRYDELIALFEPLKEKNVKGGVTDFTFKGRPLKDIIIGDFMKEMELEFPENFK